MAPASDFTLAASWRSKYQVLPCLCFGKEEEKPYWEADQGGWRGRGG